MQSSVSHTVCPDPQSQTSVGHSRVPCQSHRKRLQSVTQAQQVRASQQATYDSSKQLGSTSAGRAMLHKKVNGFADMVQWAECVPQQPSAKAANHPQVARPRVKLQAKHAKAHVGKQGKAAGGASHRMQHTQNHCQSDATYQMTDTQAGSPQKPFPPNESSHQPIPHDLHLQRLQAAALAWRTAAQTTADAQQARGADEIMFTAAPLEESRMQSNTYTASNEGISVSHKQHQPSSIQQSPQWQPQGRPPSQHQNAHTLLSAAEYQSSAQIHGGQHVDNSVAAAARWTSPAMQQGTHLAGAYTSPAALYDNMETSSPSAAFVERDLLAIPTASGEAMENSASELMWGWDERWPYNAREPVMHNSHNYVGHISENMMEVAPPPPPYMHGIGQKPKATWWAAMKGEAHPCKLR